MADEELNTEVKKVRMEDRSKLLNDVGNVAEEVERLRENVEAALNKKTA